MGPELLFLIEYLLKSTYKINYLIEYTERKIGHLFKLTMKTQKKFDIFHKSFGRDNERDVTLLAKT